jgi:hypothetical protein
MRDINRVKLDQQVGQNAASHTITISRKETKEVDIPLNLDTCLGKVSGDILRRAVFSSNLAEA